MDQEQLKLGSSAAFWKLIAARRREKTLTRAEVEQAIAKRERGNKKPTKKSK